MDPITKGRNRRLSLKTKAVLEALKSGKSSAALAQELGVSRQAVNLHIRRAGFSALDFRPPKEKKLSKEERYALRFWSYVDRQNGTPEKCWLWKRFIDIAGYGKTSLRGKAHYAHRVAFELHWKKQPTYVMHTCDNRACVNPFHLIESTHQANMADRDFKGRGRWGGRKLDSDAKASLLKAYSDGRPIKEIRARFDVTGQTINLHVRRAGLPKRAVSSGNFKGRA